MNLYKHVESSHEFTYIPMALKGSRKRLSPFDGSHDGHLVTSLYTVTGVDSHSV